MRSCHATIRVMTWGVTNMAAPVHYLSASAIGMRVAELIMKWSNPDLARTIRFWQHLLPIYLGYMKTKWLLRNKSMQERDESWAKTHEWGGQKVHNLVLDLSGFYVKSAQILATKAIVKEIQSTIPLEFDFEREAWFMETIKRNLEKQNFRDIVCPIPYLNLCTKRLIVMQRLDGIRFTQVLCPNASEDLLARIPEMVGSIHSLLQAYGQMLFVDGVFHADPHAGNLLLLLDGRLGLLDYGQCKVLDAETRLKLAKIVLALSDNDDVEIARALLDAEMVFENITGDDISVSDFSTVARILFDVSYVEEATVSPTAQNSILRRTPLKSFNRALWLVVRAIFILRGLCFMLKIDTSAATIWRPYALVALQEKHS